MKTSEHPRVFSRLVVALILCGVLCAGYSQVGRDQESGPKTNPVVSNLLAAAAREQSGCLEYDANRELIGLKLAPVLANDANLNIAAQIDTLQSLTLYGKRDNGNLTPSGLSALQKSKSLNKLSFSCFPEMERGIFEALAGLTNISSLEISATDIDAEEFQHIANMRQLEELKIRYASRLDDRHFDLLSTLPKLRSVEFRSTGLTMKSVRLLPKFPFLTNAFIGSERWRTNWSLPKK